MEHTAQDGAHKILGDRGLTLTELAPGVDVQRVTTATAAPFKVAEGLL
jgi:acyl CoA:acetate/3-ketoacid CoA transferase beta subunit